MSILGAVIDTGIGRFDLRQNRCFSDVIHKGCTLCDIMLIKKSNLPDKTLLSSEEDGGRTEEHLNNCTRPLRGEISRRILSYNLIPMK